MSSSSTSHGYFDSVSTQLSLSVGSSFEDVADNSAANASEGVSAGVSAVDTGMNGKVIEERSMNYTSYKDYIKIPFLFQGQYYDEEIKLAYNRFRYYDPELGRYISEDPIGLESGKIGLYHYVDNSLVFLDIFGLDVRDGIGRTHVKYSGLKNGKPYHSYASASSDLNLTAEDIIIRRYNNDFSAFNENTIPNVDYVGKDKEGKNIARGLEQLDFESAGGLEKTANKQNPVGPHNKNREAYRNAALNYKKNSKKRKKKISYNKQ